MALADGAGPLYQQVINLIRSNIEKGLWPDGHQIPSERELCDMYSISRTTVRLAIGEAVKLNLLTRTHGKGTFVSARKIQQPLIQFTSFAETLTSRGLTPSTQVVSVRSGPADLTTARLLGLLPGDEVTSFDLVGLGDGDPMALYCSVVPAQIAEPVRAEIKSRTGGQRYYLVNTMLAERYGWAFLRAEQTYEAIQAGADEARLLHVPRRAPLLRVESLFINPQEQPVEFRRATYRADKYQFRVTRQMYFTGGGTD